MLSQSKTAVSSPPSPASIPEPKSSKPCSSPHPSAVSLSSHLHNDRHRPFHKSLPCKTHSPFFLPTSIRKLKTKHNRTHKHQLSFFFFYSDLDTFIFSALLCDSRIPPSWLPTSCPSPGQKSLSQTTAQSHTHDSSVPTLPFPMHMDFHPALLTSPGVVHTFPRGNIKFRGHIHTACLNTEEWPHTAPSQPPRGPLLINGAQRAQLYSQDAPCSPTKALTPPDCATALQCFTNTFPKPSAQTPSHRADPSTSAPLPCIGSASTC